MSPLYESLDDLGGLTDRARGATLVIPAIPALRAKCLAAALWASRSGCAYIVIVGDDSYALEDEIDWAMLADRPDAGGQYPATLSFTDLDEAAVYLSVAARLASAVIVATDEPELLARVRATRTTEPA